MSRFPDEAALRKAGLIPAIGYGTGGIWQTGPANKPGKLYLVLLPPNVSVGPQYGPPLWKGPLTTQDELNRCVRHYGQQLTSTP